LPAELTQRPCAFRDGRDIRILIADDHEMIRAGLRRIIEGHESWRICAEAATGREAVELAKKFVPQVVILDLVMPELNGLEATRQIKQCVPITEVLIFSIHDSMDLIRQATEAGALGYLPKSDISKHIEDAVAALVEHDVYFFSSFVRAMLDVFVRDGGAGKIDPLTSREREVIQLLTEGHSNKSAAQRLNISQKTVETHRQVIMDKLGIHSMAHLVRYAVRNRIIVP